MSVILKKIKIENFLNTKNLSWDLQQVNVLVGKNGSGKTSILKIIDAILNQKEDDLNCLHISDKVEIFFNDDVVITSNKFVKETKLIEALYSLAGNKKILKQLEKLENNSSFSVEIEQSQAFDKKNIDKLIELLNSDENFKSRRAYRFEQPKNNKEISIGNYLNEINTEFISTVNLSSNSISQYISSDGNIKSTILDLEIEKEFLKLKIDENKIKKDTFVSSINVFFRETDKIMFYENENFKFRMNNEEVIKLKDLSSGERQLLFIFLKLINSPPKTIFLMDEPEISLHLEWQEKLISEILKISPTCQLIIVTHSPAIVMNGWMNSYVDIDNIVVE